MKPWTTPVQTAWLKERIPQWHKVYHKHASTSNWISVVAANFCAEFSVPQPQRAKLPVKIRRWFYNHGKAKSSKPVPVGLLAKPPQKVVRLSQTHAYTRLFCKRGSALYEELFSAWELYASANEDAVKKYGYLFNKHNPNIPFVVFQQAILRERIDVASAEELATIQEFIETRFTEETERHDHPWKALKVEDVVSHVELERQYVQAQIEDISERLGAVCDEVKRTTNFNTFVLTGGPTSSGTSGFQLFHISCGQTNMSGQTFEQFLGSSLWDTLKNKYGEWLRASYSREEVLRLEGSITGLPRASPALRAMSPSPTSNPTQTPTTVRQSDFNGSPTPLSRTSLPTPRLAEVVKETLDGSDRSPSRMSTEPPPSRASSPTPHLAEVVEETPDCSDRSPSRMPTEPPPSRSDSSTNLSPSQTQQGWTPSHHPSWTLGREHRPYIHSAAFYLIRVPGGPEWEKLLASYITFESLSSARSGLSKLPTNPCPEELARWFKYGCRFNKKDIPAIESVQDFETNWVAWWSDVQPEWRDTSDWPFSQDNVVEHNWGDLPDGGKDGLFLVVVSLGWWILTRNPSEGSRLDEAIKDVAWVINNLVSFLYVDATVGSDTMPAPPSPLPSNKHSNFVKIGPPLKRAKRTSGRNSHR